jgi:hypothetical protein
MNERIKELLLQAALEALKEEPTDYIACDLLKCERFAELIVKECAESLMSAEDRPVGTEWLVHRMKNHFGVE